MVPLMSMVHIHWDLLAHLGLAQLPRDELCVRLGNNDVRKYSACHMELTLLRQEKN